MSEATQVYPWRPKMFAKQFDVFNVGISAPPEGEIDLTPCVLVCGPRMTGKCVDEDTVIPCDGKLMRIRRISGEMALGEYRPISRRVVSYDVDGHSFKPAEADLFYREKETAAIKVTLDSGIIITGSEKHPLWSCVDGRMDYRTTTEIKSMIIAGKDVFLPVRVGCPEWTSKEYASVGIRTYVKRKSESPSHTILMDEEIGWMLGALCGDGCLTERTAGKIGIGFSSTDEEMLSMLRDILQRRFNSSLKHRSRCDWFVRSNVLMQFIRHLGMNVYAHEKQIPDLVLESPKSVVVQFLRGLFDTDGHADKRGLVQFCSTSEKLSRNVQQLLLALGISSKIYFKCNDGRGAWMLDILGDAYLFYEAVGFSLTRKQDRSKLLTTKRKRKDGYPREFRPALHSAYMSRHSRGAPRGDMSRTATMPNTGSLFRNGCGVSRQVASSLIDIGYAKELPEIQRYFMHGEVVWQRVTSAVNTTANLYDISVPGPCNFVANGVINHNTIAIVNRILRHLWETPNARAAVFSKTLKVAKDGGIWDDLLDGMKEWLEAGIKGKNGQFFEYTSTDAKGKPGPKLDSQTRTISFKIRNWHGGESELKLFSLDHDKDVEAKVKSTRFSLMWFSELSLFGDRQVFTVSRKQLRMKHLKPSQHLWIADTNPHEDGEDHWIYQQWYVDRLRGEDSFRDEINRLPATRRPKDAEFDKLVRNKMAYRKALQLIEIFLDDNTFLDEGQRLALEEEEAIDPGQYARNVEGRWVKGHGNVGKHFADVFFPDIHIIGSDDKAVGDSIGIPADTTDLLTSWDTGSINHSAHVLERRIIQERAFWMVHDENVIIGDRISTSEFALEMLLKMDALERFERRLFQWEHFSDNSADVWRASGDGTTDAMEIEAATGGRVQLQMVVKPKYSVRARVRMLRFLLKQNRIFVAARCVRTIEMLYHCARGKAETEYVLENEHKHPFDSLTYAIYMMALRDPDPEFYIGGSRPRAVRREVAFVE